MKNVFLNSLFTFLKKLLIDLIIPILFTIISIVVTSNLQISMAEGLIIDILFFFGPLLAVDIIKREYTDNSNSYIKRTHFIDKSLPNADAAIESALAHLSEDCYMRCSTNSNYCAKCDKRNECSGLLRDYLNRSITNLQKAMHDSKEGSFVLNTNIEIFHTVAVEHLVGYGCKTYSVVQYLYPDAPDADDPEYDALDFDFLKVLLQTINSLPKNKQIKVRWLFIGDKTHIKNNYDYILFVINELNLSDAVTGFLEFACISENEYSNSFTSKRNKLSKFAQNIYGKTPSVGIFGDYFAFADDLVNPSNHGTIYTNYYRGFGANNGVTELLAFFEIMYGSKHKKTLPHSELQEQYKALIKDDPNWETTLSERQEK